MARSWAIVTGAGSGIGAALTHRIIRGGVSVVAVGRRKSALDDTMRAAPAESPASARLVAVAADITSPEGRASICSAIPTGDELRFLVHNAAVGDPNSPEAGIDLEHFRYALEVNLVAPLELSQMLKERLAACPRSGGGRVLHLGSGVAKTVQPGTGIYGITKLAFLRLQQQLSSDWAGANVVVGSARPGVVDTEGMRDHVAKANALKLPHANYFNKLFLDGNIGMQSLDVVSEFLWLLLTKCPADEFGQKEHTINETTPWWQGSNKAQLE